jgi:hypothetical protein
MPIPVTQLDAIPQETVDQVFEQAAQLVLEAEPGLDARRGVVGQLLLGLDAILAGAAQTTTDRLRQSLSLLAISENPDLADPDIVDAVLSNYRITRRDSAQAVGEVTIVLDRLVAVTIPAGAVFESNSHQYTADAAYAARTAQANVISDTDRLLVKIAEDRYAFTISVTAVEPGQAGQARKDDKFTPLTLPLGFVSAHATDDFTGASDPTTNAELLAALEGGLAARAFSNRVTTAAMIAAAPAMSHALADPEFANIEALSFVGAGDPEMLRDQHWIFPTSGGGKVDVYLRSQPRYSEIALRKTATLISRNAEGGVWQFSIGKDEAPGFYEPSRIVVAGDEGASGYAVEELIRGLDDTADDTPDLESALEASFSRYQATTVRFLDTDTTVTAAEVGSRVQDYDVTVRVMPLVAELQAYLSDRSVTDPAGDILVKAAIPCFLTLSFVLQRRRTDAAVDMDRLASDLASYVNDTKFPGKLYASDLLRIISAALPANVSAGVVEMFGRILKPDGSNLYIRSTEVLTIPTDYSNFLSGRTVAFFLDPQDVASSDVHVDVPAI